MPEINLTINGKSLTAEAGQTILQVAQANGIRIPTLCFHPDLAPLGACRVCLVEIEGERGLQPSCAFPARDGMIVLNTAEGRTKVENVRRDPRVAVSIHDAANPHPPVAVLGTVVEITSEGALEHIDMLARRYTGEAWTPHEGQTRLILVIRPDRVLGWTMANLADPRGYFYFQKTPRHANRIPYMRWSQAWMFRALTAWTARSESKLPQAGNQPAAVAY